MDPDIINAIDKYVEKFQYLSRSSFLEYVAKKALECLHDMREFYGDGK